MKVILHSIKKQNWKVLKKIADKNHKNLTGTGKISYNIICCRNILITNAYLRHYASYILSTIIIKGE